MEKNNSTRYSEPMYDDWILEQIEKQHMEELVAGLPEYCKQLEKQVVGLRCEVNQLTPPGSSEPYPEPPSGIAF